MTETVADLKQIRGLVKERNEYRQLLDECLNILPNKKVEGVSEGTTYALAKKIKSSFYKFDR